MKLLGRRNIRAQARPFGGNPTLVALRIGAADYVLTPAEAVSLAASLVDAVDRSKARLDAEGAIQ